MKTIDFIKTIQWMESMVGPTAKELLFSKRIFRPSQNEKIPIEGILGVSNDIALAQQAISKHPFALKILTAFGIEKLFDSTFVGELLASLISPGPAKRVSEPEVWAMFQTWDAMLKCAKEKEGNESLEEVMISVVSSLLTHISCVQRDWLCPGDIIAHDGV